MYELIACKGEIYYKTLVAKSKVGYRKYDLQRNGYTIVSCLPVKQTNQS